jgi:hypothetical protein
MPDTEIQIAAKRGFVQGVAWAIALQHHYNLGSDQMLHESGLALADFVDARVVESDLKAVKAAAKLGGVWKRRKRADNGDPDTIVPAPAPHKKHPGFPARDSCI